jgi:hypothetical protein
VFVSVAVGVELFNILIGRWGRILGTTSSHLHPPLTRRWKKAETSDWNEKAMINPPIGTMGEPYMRTSTCGLYFVVVVRVSRFIYSKTMYWNQRVLEE